MTGGSEPAAEITETHCSWVVFMGDRAFKRKKPVKLDFLDFTTREAREAVAHREVELNRRLTPDVYLGVADVVGPDGQVCDHLVVMRRMPEKRRLSTLVRAGASLDAEIRAIARVVAAFHARAETSPEIDIAGHPATVRRRIDRDLEEMRAFTADRLDDAVLDADTLYEVASLARGYLDGRTPLLEARVANRCIRDGHGDLLADDIFCLPDGPRILDCIEFDDRLRHGDVLADVAFLVMDLERLGAPELAERFLDCYRGLANEQHPATLVHYYVASRALIRSKVACVRLTQHSMPGGEASRRDAAALLELARRNLRDARVRLVLVGGAPGTGKSTLATGIADRLGWALLRSDEVRKDVAELGHATRAEAPVEAGIYDPATTRATYDALLDRARHALELGEPVVLDASWSERVWREAAAGLARDTASDLAELRCELPADLALARIDHRREHRSDVSDASAEVAETIRARFDPWPSARTIRTDVPVEQSLSAALGVLES